MEDYEKDDWFQPSSSRETKFRVVEKSKTRVSRKTPKVTRCPWSEGDVVAKHRLGKLLGSGGQGWVFAATRLIDSQEVALKLIYVGDKEQEVGQKATTRAKNGFRKMSQLRHPGLVRAYQVLHDKGCVAFSMEKIDGTNLVKAMRRWREKPLEEACEHVLEMIRQIGSALAWMHSHSMIHRDVKSSNVMVTPDYQRFVLVDCDLTGDLEDAKDASAARPYLIFTPMYVAPEVVFRQTSLAASDIFGLGMVVLETLRAISAAQRKREIADVDRVGSMSQEVQADIDADHDVDSTENSVPRDEDNLQADRECIDDALMGLHPSIPTLLRDTVREMLSHRVSDRPMAASLHVWDNPWRHYILVFGGVRKPVGRWPSPSKPETSSLANSSVGVT